MKHTSDHQLNTCSLFSAFTMVIGRPMTLQRGTMHSGRRHCTSAIFWILYSSANMGEPPLHGDCTLTCSAPAHTTAGIPYRIMAPCCPDALYAPPQHAPPKTPCSVQCARQASERVGLQHPCADCRCHCAISVRASWEDGALLCWSPTCIELTHKQHAVVFDRDLMMVKTQTQVFAFVCDLIILSIA